VLLVTLGASFIFYEGSPFSPVNFTGNGSGHVQVQITPGETASGVGETLVADNVVASVSAFTAAATASGHPTALEPGYYEVKQHMSAAAAFALLLNPKSRVQTRVLVQEGLRVTDIIHLLGTATHDLSGYQAAVNDTKALGLPPYADGDAEGYLFPATYDIQPNESPIDVARLMVATFEQQVATVNLAATAKADDITETQAIIIASLVQAEGGSIADYGKIARVIYNRLNASPPMKLELDSTVMFALHTTGIRASSSQLQVNSPFNTYLHFGLPPGPIDDPGLAAIQAALHPTPGDWLYFVTVNPKTGLTRFTASATQFEQFTNELDANLAKEH
jgi:UPF0755 protein